MQRHRPAVGPQHRLGARERVLLAAAHDRERAVLGAGLPARDRGIDEVAALLAASCVSSRATSAEAVVWSTRIAPCGEPGQGAVGSQRYRAQVVIVADAGENDLGADRSLAGRSGALAAKLLAPCSAPAAVRLQTVTSWPLPARWPAIGKPITPNPMKATLVMPVLPLQAGGR